MRFALVYMNNERNVGRGAGCVAASLLAAGHEVSFFDTYYVPPAAVAKRVAAGSFDALMVSSMTMLFPEAVRLVREVKRRAAIPVLVGGIHATIRGAALLEEHPEIDYLCIGEGESMVVEFAERLATDGLKDVRNLVWRRGAEVVTNPVREAEDLSGLPVFPWHLFSPESVVMPDTRFAYVNATRGCPYNCSYCVNGIYLKLYGKSYLRFRPIEDILGELEYLKRTYAPGLFYFGDEMILSDPQRAVELFRAVKERVGTPWGCMARVEYLTEPVVDAMAEAGCQYIAMGVECGDEEFRRKVLRRSMPNEAIEAAFRLVKSRGIYTSSFNMIGYPYPGDAERTEKTIALNERLRPGYVQVSIFYPFPGTAMYDHCVEEDLIDPAKYARTTDYFKESVLRGVSLHDRAKEITERLNPEGFHPPGGTAAPTATDGLARRRVLVLGEAGTRARALVAAGWRVNVVDDLRAAEDVHRLRDGAGVHSYSCGVRRGWPKHASLAGLLAWVPPSHTRLRSLAARTLWLAESVVWGRRAFGIYAESVLRPFVADVVHVRGRTMLEAGRRAAAAWGARLVWEPGPGDGTEAVAEAALALTGGESDTAMVAAYEALSER